MFKIVKRQDMDSAHWNAAADTMDTAWAWHHGDLIDARATWIGTTDISFAVIDDSQSFQILALMPVVHVCAGRVPALFGGHLESTGGPVIDPTLPHRTHSKVLTLLRTHVQELAMQTGARRLDMSAPPLAPQALNAQGPVPNPFCFYGAADSSTQSWLLPLLDQDEESLWQNLEHRSRKEIKKARRNELQVISCVPDADLLQTYYALHTQTCQRNGIPPHPRAYFETIFLRIAQQGMSRCYVVKQGEEILSILNFLLYKDMALYWTTACQPKALSLSANDLGFWSAVLDLQGLGIRCIECGEAFPGAQSGKMKGLNDFKKSFGGTLYPYFRGQIVFKPIVEASITIALSLLKRDGK